MSEFRFSTVPSWDDEPIQTCGEGLPAVAIALWARPRWVRFARLPLTWWQMWLCLRRDPPLGIGGRFVPMRLAWRFALGTTRRFTPH